MISQAWQAVCGGVGAVCGGVGDREGHGAAGGGLPGGQVRQGTAGGQVRARDRSG